MLWATGTVAFCLWFHVGLAILLFAITGLAFSAYYLIRKPSVFTVGATVTMLFTTYMLSIPALLGVFFCPIGDGKWHNEYAEYLGRNELFREYMCVPYMTPGMKLWSTEIGESTAKAYMETWTLREDD